MRTNRPSASRQTARVTHVLIIVLLVIATASNAGADWVWQNPLPQANELKDVHFADAMTGLAVGDGGTILRTIDGGNTWEILSSGTTEYLNGVHMSNTTTGVTVGGEGVILRTTDGGNTWLPQSSGTTVLLRSVYMVDVDKGVVVGWYDGGEGEGTILRTLNGGVTWIRAPSGTPYSLEDVTFIDANTGVAVGSHETILRTVDGGVHWTIVRESSSRYEQLFGVAFADTNTGVAVGRSGKVFQSVDGGLTWTPRVCNTANWLRGVSFLDDGTAVAAGTDLFRSTDSGVTWSVISNPANVPLMGITCPANGAGVAVGEDGAIIKTDDSGGMWTDKRSGYTDVAVYGVCFTDVSTGIAVAHSSSAIDGGAKILRTSDYGTTWTIQTGGTAAIINDLSFPDPLNGVAAGDSGTVIRTTDGGANWTVHSVGVTERLSGISMLNANTGLAVGWNGTVLRTDDGGVNWAAQTSGTTEPLWDVCFIQENHAVVVGDYTILHTTDGGTTWEDVPHDVPGAWLYGVSFADANNGLAVGDLKTILRTDDGGTTWTVQLSSYDDAEIFRAVSYADELNAIAVGWVEQATVNCMRTTDGGVTWVAENVGVARSLLDVHFENGAATVTGFAGTILRSETGSVAVTLQEYFSSWKQNHVEVCWRLIDIDGDLDVEVARACGPNEPFHNVQNPAIDQHGETFVFEDHAAEPGKTYRYRVVVMEGGVAVASFETQVNTIAAELSLLQNHPNPFNPGTRIPFVIDEPRHVSLLIYDASGRLVRTLVDRQMIPGAYSEIWDGRNADGDRVASGMYFYRLNAGNRTLTRKALLLK